jgi:hypothetical protein
MDWQTAFNVAIGLAGTLLGWFLNVIRESVRDLQAADANLATKVQSIELLVAGQYPKRDEMERIMQAIFNKLEKIENKLDNKVDRSECERFHDK